jgi:hypothetical protein
VYSNMLWVEICQLELEWPWHPPLHRTNHNFAMTSSHCGDMASKTRNSTRDHVTATSKGWWFSTWLNHCFQLSTPTCSNQQHWSICADNSMRNVHTMRNKKSVKGSIELFATTLRGWHKSDPDKQRKQRWHLSFQRREPTRPIMPL